MESLWAEADPTRCQELRKLEYYNLVVSILLLVGILISYLPQHFRIISRGTSEGISPYFILLGTTSSTCGFANILLSPASRTDVACCKTISSLECFAGLLGIAQVGTQWFCFSIILFLFLVFFPRDETLPANLTVKSSNWRTALTVAFLCLLHGLATIIISAALIYSHPNYLKAWSDTLGITATILAGVQYLPQIWTTWSLGHVGSLSIPMMVIQTPGSFLWAGSLYARWGTQAWSTWGIYLVTGCLQGCLLAMGISFELQARTRKRANENGNLIIAQVEDILEDTDDEGAVVVENGPQTERTPLLDSRKASRT